MVHHNFKKGQKVYCILRNGSVVIDKYVKSTGHFLEFENCENYVISKDRIKEQIKKYAKLSDNFYGKWKNLSPFDEDYKNIRDKGMCCDAIVNALQELLEGRK